MTYLGAIGSYFGFGGGEKYIWRPTKTSSYPLLTGSILKPHLIVFKGSRFLAGLTSNDASKLSCMQLRRLSLPWNP